MLANEKHLSRLWLFRNDRRELAPESDDLRLALHRFLFERQQHVAFLVRLEDVVLAVTFKNDLQLIAESFRGTVQIFRRLIAVALQRGPQAVVGFHDDEFVHDKDRRAAGILAAVLVERVCSHPLLLGRSRKAKNERQ